MSDVNLSERTHVSARGNLLCSDHLWAAEGCPICWSIYEKRLRNACIGLLLVGEFHDIVKGYREDNVRLHDRANAAYTERNRVIAALAQAVINNGGKAWHATHDEAEPGWRTLVFIELPTGQASWHIPDSEAGLFDFLPCGPNAWDGHTTEQKYERLDRFARL